MMRRNLATASLRRCAAEAGGQQKRGRDDSSSPPDPRHSGSPSTAKDVIMAKLDFVHGELCAIDGVTVGALAPAQEYSERPVHLCDRHDRRYWLQYDAAADRCAVSLGPDVDHLRLLKPAARWGEVDLLVRDGHLHLVDPDSPVFQPFVREATADHPIPRDAFVAHIVSVLDAEPTMLQNTHTVVLRNVSGVGKTRSTIDLRQFASATTAKDWEVLPLYLGFSSLVPLTPHELLKTDRTPQRAVAAVLHRLLCVLRQLPLPDPDRPERTVLERLLVPYGECPGDFVDPRFDEKCRGPVRSGSLPVAVADDTIATLLNECRDAVLAVAHVFETLPLSKDVAGKPRRLAVLPIVDEGQLLPEDFPVVGKGADSDQANAPRLVLRYLRQLQLDVHVHPHNQGGSTRVLGIMTGIDPVTWVRDHTSGVSTVVSDEHALFTNLDDALAATAAAANQRKEDPERPLRRAVMLWPAIRGVFGNLPIPTKFASASSVRLLDKALSGNSVPFADLDDGLPYCKLGDKKQTAVPIASYALLDGAFTAAMEYRMAMIPVGEGPETTLPQFPALIEDSETPEENERGAGGLLLRLAVLKLSGLPGAHGAFQALELGATLGRIAGPTKSLDRVQVCWQSLQGNGLFVEAENTGDVLTRKDTFTELVRDTLASVRKGCAGKPCAFMFHTGGNTMRDFVLLTTVDGVEWQLLVADATRYRGGSELQESSQFLADGDQYHRKLTPMLTEAGFRMGDTADGTVKDVVLAPRVLKDVPSAQLLTGASFPAAAHVLGAVLEVSLPTLPVVE